MSNARPAAIAAHGIVKRYGDLVAVDGVDLRLEAGMCLGLLGPNGAGKTTTIEILEGLKKADAGTVEILGLTWRRNAQEIRERIGVQLQETRFPERLTVFEILRLFSSFYKNARDVEEVLDWVDLGEKRKARTGKLSGGQLQRLALGCALINRPDVLFLDEPTTGLDPQARRRLWEIIEHFKAEGGSVLLTTHYMDEAERVADDLLIIDHGKTIATGSPTAIIASLGGENIVRFTLENGRSDELESTLSRLPGVVATRHEEDAYLLTVQETHSTMSALLDRLRAEGAVLSNLETHRPTLEDVFVALTGRHLREN